MSLRLVNWNVEWATPRSRRSTEILSRIGEHAPEVICLTEAHIGLLSRDGHTICSQSDYGYPTKEGRRKVLLWSREPWEQIDDVGIDSMPPGRFVSGVTLTSVGEATIIGVCIPWFGSRTEARRKLECKMRWEDHGQYLGRFRRSAQTGVYEAVDRDGGLQSADPARWKHATQPPLGASACHPAAHDDRNLCTWLPRTQKHRPHRIE